MKSVVVSLLIAISMSAALSAEMKPIPKDKTSLAERDWFPYTISKIAPLEWWTFVGKSEDIVREEYPDDYSFRTARQNLISIPRFCFTLFRPTLRDYSALREAVEEYKGDVIWEISGDCINATQSRSTFYPPMTPEVMQQMAEAMRNPPKADPEFVKRAIADIPNLCTFLEERLGLSAKAPLEFDPNWLTLKGLALSRPETDDFYEPGSWSVFLARDPERFSENNRKTSADDRQLHIGIDMFAQSELLSELGAKWDEQTENGGDGLILRDFPLLSRLSDVTADTIYEPTEVDALLAEYERAGTRIQSPKAIRGLNNLIRIARWAKRLNLGIYFGGQ